MAIFDNGDAIRANFIPCETNPDTGGLSRTREPFHGKAEVTVGSQKGTLRHVCGSCAQQYHRHQQQRQGVIWS